MRKELGMTEEEVDRMDDIIVESYKVLLIEANKVGE